MKKNTNIRWISVLSYLLILVVPMFNFAGTASAQASLDNTVSAEDKAKFDEILTPVAKIYNFIKYAASLIAVIALLFAGISYMLSGNDAVYLMKLYNFVTGIKIWSNCCFSSSVIVVFSSAAFTTGMPTIRAKNKNLAITSIYFHKLCFSVLIF
jgi:type IV secretory pathway VirB2 component (pilin)